MLLEKLSTIRQENAMLKFTLSELVDKSVMSDFLLKAEKINNELIANDESLVLLIDSAIQIQSKFKNAGSNNLDHYVGKKHELEEDFKTFEKRFLFLKERFNNEMITRSV